MKTRTYEVTTGGRPAIADLTAECARFVEGAGDGLLNVFVPHATCGVAIFELGAGSEPDVLAAIERVLPLDDRWVHRHGSPGHGAHHVLPAFVAPSIVVPVLAGRLGLGTWQSITLVDTNVDNARRTVRLSFVPG